MYQKYYIFEIKLLGSISLLPANLQYKKEHIHQGLMSCK